MNLISFLTKVHPPNLSASCCFHETLTCLLIELTVFVVKRECRDDCDMWYTRRKGETCKEFAFQTSRKEDLVVERIILELMLKYSIWPLNELCHVLRVIIDLFPPCALKIDAAFSSETLVSVYQTTSCYIPEARNIDTFRREDLAFLYISIVVVNFRQ